MNIHSQINGLCKQIVDKFKPQKVILFGSHAYGSPNEDSDVDLLVIMQFEGRSVRQAIKIRQNISSEFPLDLMVRTPEQLKRRLLLGDFFFNEIINSGKVLYESGN